MDKKQTRTPRLKYLLNDLPPGFIIDAAWLRARGIDSKSIHYYVSQGWLERIIRGVYLRPVPKDMPNRRKLSWEAVLVSLQQLMGHSVHLGGISALKYAGRIPYEWMGISQRIHFYGNAPSWLKRLPTIDKIILHKSTLFGDDPVGIVDRTSPLREITWTVRVWGWPMKVSCRERALFELMDELGGDPDFEFIEYVFGRLNGLRPHLLIALLKACRSVKVRRLFFVFADLYQHPWREDLDVDQFDLGSGPRAFVPGGKFHPTYHISLPELFVDTSYEDECEF